MWRITPLLFASSAPLRSKRETNTDKAKADHHIPGANSWHWVTSRGYIENNDPDKPGKKGPHHHRSQPPWALLRKGYGVKEIGRDDLLRLFAELGFRHRRG